MKAALRSQFSVRMFLVAVAGLAVIAAITGPFASRKLGANDLDRLLAGDDDISLQGFRIELQQRAVDCSDPIVTEYLSKMLRESAISVDGIGYTYLFTLRFSSGRTYSLHGYVGPSQFSLSVPNAKPHETGFPTHNVVLQSPIPKDVETIFAFLVAPWEDVGGLELDIRGNKEMRYTYLPSLHGGNPRGKRVEELVLTSPQSSEPLLRFFGDFTKKPETSRRFCGLT